MGYILGIDIGGTKFHLRARRSNGRDVNLVVPATGHVDELGSVKLIRDLSLYVKNLQAKIRDKDKIDAICIGMSGLDSAQDYRDVLRELNKQTWWKQADPNRRLLVNDIMIGLRAGTDSENAIALISGTGSNACAFENGNQFCVSGKGQLLSDEGSGYSIGISALRSATRAEDGRGASTKILPYLLKHFKVSSMNAVADKLKSTNSKIQIGKLSFIVEKAAEDGDAVARGIIKDSADELVLMVTTLRKKALKRQKSVYVILIGGTINKNKPLLREFLRKIRKHRWVTPVPLLDDPVEGAIKLAEDTK